VKRCRLREDPEEQAQELRAALVVTAKTRGAQTGTATPHRQCHRIDFPWDRQGRIVTIRAALLEDSANAVRSIGRPELTKIIHALISFGAVWYDSDGELKTFAHDVVSAMSEIG